METFQTIKEWVAEDRPREKMRERGSAALTNAELLAILINTGTKQRTAMDIAKEVLQLGNQNLLQVAKLGLSDLLRIKGMGEKKALTLLTALELGRRRQISQAMERPHIRSSRDAYELLEPHFMGASEENFFAMYLSQSNRVLEIKRISTGGITATLVDPRVVFKGALHLKTCTQFIVAHNHPSGNITASQADLDLTKKLKEAGKLLDIRLVDHLILAGSSYMSLADEGLMT